MMEPIVEKSCVIGVGAVGAVWGGLSLAISDPATWGSLWERGGVALVIVVCAFLIGRATVPAIANWVRGYLEGLEKRNADTQRRWEERMDKSQSDFLAEMREERASRERTETAFREALHESKKETVAAIKEQTGYVSELVKELKDRPCQGLTFRKSANDPTPH
jgi:Sec-independent protein translocase protein TatA